MNQTRMVGELLREESFALIVMDAGRYDTFERLHRRHLNGSLKPSYSHVSSTHEWLTRNLPVLSQNTPTIFSSHPFINSKGIPVGGLRVTDHLPKEKIIDLWESHWNQGLGTVQPQEINKVFSSTDPQDRNILWYIQPHFPWISDPTLSRRLIEESDQAGTRLDRHLADQIERGNLSRDRVRRTYEANLDTVLHSVSKLVDSLADSVERIVVTSDHGELLGEHGLCLHRSNLQLPELTTVPWFVIST
jgi:hypothetical protein